MKYEDSPAKFHPEPADDMKDELQRLQDNLTQAINALPQQLADHFQKRDGGNVTSQDMAKLMTIVRTIQRDIGQGATPAGRPRLPSNAGAVLPDPHALAYATMPIVAPWPSTGIQVAMAPPVVQPTIAPIPLPPPGPEPNESWYAVTVGWLVGVFDNHQEVIQYTSGIRGEASIRFNSKSQAIFHFNRLLAAGQVKVIPRR